MHRKPSSNHPLLSNLSLVAGVIVIVAIVAGIYFWRHHSQNTASTTITTNSGTATANPNVPGTQTPDGNPSTGAGASKQTPSNTPGPSLSAGIQPDVPTGQFVSNHHPSLSSQNTETSVCTTTPGAYCQIKFTSGGIVKTLPQQKTNENGSTDWNNWTLQSVGLTRGSWDIVAVAVNGNKTANTKDALQLVVGL